jgi:alpha-L-rhamnosidase
MRAALGLGLTAAATLAGAPRPAPIGLLANQLASPAVGVTAGGPLAFTWVVPHIEACAGAATSVTAPQLQTAHQLSLVQVGGGSSNPEWTSPKTDSNSSVNVPYAGPPLEPGATYRWHVKVWVGGAGGVAIPCER